MNQTRFKELYELGKTTAVECQLPVSNSSLPLVIIHPYMKTSGVYSWDHNTIYLKERCDKPTTTILHEIGHSVLVCLYEPRSWHEVDMQRYMLELMVNSLRDSFNRKDYQHIDPVVIDIDEYFRRTFSMKVKYHGESFADIMASANPCIVIDYIKGSYVENVVDVMLTDIEKDILETIVRLMNKYKRATTMMYPLRKAGAYAMIEAIKTSMKTR